MGRELVPRVPSPKLIPQGDGDVGVPWDAHVCPEASRARRILSVLLKARGSRGRVHVYPHLRAELLQLARVAARLSRCEVLGRVSPCRVGWRSLAVVALGREMVTLLPLLRSWAA